VLPLLLWSVTWMWVVELGGVGCKCEVILMELCEGIQLSVWKCHHRRNYNHHHLVYIYDWSVAYSTASSKVRSIVFYLNFEYLAYPQGSCLPLLPLLTCSSIFPSVSYLTRHFIRKTLLPFSCFIECSMFLFPSLFVMQSNCSVSQWITEMTTTVYLL
jgi:hypothetical protein